MRCLGAGLEVGVLLRVSRKGVRMVGESVSMSERESETDCIRSVSKSRSLCEEE